MMAAAAPPPAPVPTQHSRAIRTAANLLRLKMAALQGEQPWLAGADAARGKHPTRRPHAASITMLSMGLMVSTRPLVSAAHAVARHPRASAIKTPRLIVATEICQGLDGVARKVGMEAGADGNGYARLRGRSGSSGEWCRPLALGAHVASRLHKYASATQATSPRPLLLVPV